MSEPFRGVIGDDYPDYDAEIESRADTPPAALIAQCQHLSTWFDRTLCAEPCGSAHVRCYRCGLPVDDCVFLQEGSDQ